MLVLVLVVELFAFGVSENNFLGRGIEFSSDISVSAESLKGIISMNNPNYKGSNRSLNTSLESTITDRLKILDINQIKLDFLLEVVLSFMMTYIGIQEFLLMLKN